MAELPIPAGYGVPLVDLETNLLPDPAVAALDTRNDGRYGTKGQGEKADTAYQKPATGVPAADLADTVKTSLGKADSAFQAPAAGVAVLNEEGFLTEDQVPERLTETLLTATFAAAPMAEAMLLQSARLSKGGVIGVGNKGVVALRFDDWHADFNTKIYPLLLARGLPAGFASISRLSEQTWSATTTPATIAGWNRNGVEIHSHGVDHKDPTPFGDAGLIDQIVTSKAEIEAWGVKCQGWMQPGATAVTGAIPYGYGATNPASDMHTTRAGQLIRQTYPVSESYNLGSVRSIPCGSFHGLDHVTISDAGYPLSAAQIMVDYAIASKQGVEFMVHAGNLGVGSNMTVAQFATFLDYIVTKWDAGLLDVLTPSGLMFADKSTQRMDLVMNGSFEDPITGVDTLGWAGLGVGHTIATTGGHSGANFLSIANTASNFTMTRPMYMDELGLGGETFLFEGWVRSNGAATTVSRILIQDYTDTSRLNLSLTRGPISNAGWTRVRHSFTLHPATTRLTIALGRSSGDGIDWDDVSVRKI